MQVLLLVYLCSTGFEDAIPLGCYCSSTEQCLFKDGSKCIGKWPDTECKQNKSKETCNDNENCTWNSDSGYCEGKEDELERSFWDTSFGGIFSSSDKPTFGICKKEGKKIKRIYNNQGLISEECFKH